VDYAAKGTTIELAGSEKVEGHPTYKLKLTFKNGQSRNVWVDASTFLEAKIQGDPRRLDGTERSVEVYFRDYRTVDGLQIPHVLETRVLPAAQAKFGQRDPIIPPERISIGKVTINPKFEESAFSKPQVGVVASAK
jgi:hypothetical protein